MLAFYWPGCWPFLRWRAGIFNWEKYILPQFSEHSNLITLLQSQTFSDSASIFKSCNRINQLEFQISISVYTNNIRWQMYPNKIMQTSTVRDCSWKYPLSQDFFEVGNFLKLTFLPIETRQNNFLKFKQVMKYAININKYCRTISFMSAKFALYYSRAFPVWKIIIKFAVLAMLWSSCTHIHLLNTRLKL